MPKSVDTERLRAEALRVYERYVVEVVEALSLCPWARRARLDGKVRALVIVEKVLQPEDILPYIDTISADSKLDIGLLLLPRLELEARPFHRFVAKVGELHGQRHQPGRAVFHMADFHPRAEPDMVSPARLVSFIRRTPDPTIQVVRRTALAAVRGTTDEGTVGNSEAILAFLVGAMGLAEDPIREVDPRPLHERVAAVNHTTIARFGVDRLRAILDDIRRDRDESYELILSGHV